jgi:hypothetical protein
VAGDQKAMTENTVDAPDIAGPDIADRSLPTADAREDTADTRSRPGHGGAASA